MSPQNLPENIRRVQERIKRAAGECGRSVDSVTLLAVCKSQPAEMVRVAALAGPGEILVSSTTHDLLEGSDLHFTDRGRHILKGLDGERQVIRLDDPGQV